MSSSGGEDHIDMVDMVDWSRHGPSTLSQACRPSLHPTFFAQDGAQALAPGLAAAINALPEMPLGANLEHPNVMMRDDATCHDVCDVIS